MTDQPMPTDTVTTVDTPPAAPIYAGTFALYEHHSGGLMLVIATPNPDGGDDLVSQRVVPAALVQMAMGMAGGDKPSLRDLARGARAALTGG